ncbi:class I SAM-dependent methyltransferase [Paraflavitalea pollutisoli]|uniref:class I SAM-dependent methyltransferase n=1 Tax=Paraflavitalea pollutisoli TaxID=3034143 RepID=UPI0023EC2999|nr:class I SAM-dependent methyltransferase [Paraflavitalea sp. H1-2-19X]
MKEKAKQLLKQIGWYHPLQSLYRNTRLQLTNLRYRILYRKYSGSGFTCNFCGASYSQFVPEYPSNDIAPVIYGQKVIAGFGEHVYCPRCLSKNRDRLVKVVLDHYLDSNHKRVLHFSPEKQLFANLSRRSMVTTVDIEPGFYKSIDKSITFADATQLQFADNSFDIIIANHILEHIPDDRKAMREIYRVLQQQGVAILQAPWSQSLPATIEEPTIADPIQQARLFGQRDHVRIYTLDDYVERLTAAGFAVRVISAVELTTYSHHAIQAGEPVVLGYKI